MVLPVSGLITLSDIQTEFGGANPIALNEYYRGGTYVPTGVYTNTIPTSGAISLQNFQGTRNVFTATISANTTSLDALAYVNSLGWNGTSAIEIIISSGVYVYSTSTSLAALYNIPTCTINNSGFIMGMGGAGNDINGNGFAGGPAMALAGNISLINQASGYIGGGGGGGSRGTDGNFSGGGGGAGGGNGGVTNNNSGAGVGGGPGSSGTNGFSTSSPPPVGGYGGSAGGGGGDWNFPSLSNGNRTGGGGGGRILPGATSGFPNVGGFRYSPGTYGGGPNQAGQNSNGSGQGSGGGGWGAAGGSSNYSGGAAGKAIHLNGNTCSISGSVSQIYGAVA